MRYTTAWRASLKMNNKMGLVTMCRKAGKLALGMDMAKDACKNGAACGVFVAEDISAKSLKEVKYVCGRYGVKLWSLGLKMDDIWNDLGKRAGVMAITDSGFAKSCAKGLEALPTDDVYSE